jgi:hypothetical protein
MKTLVFTYMPFLMTSTIATLPRSANAKKVIPSPARFAKPVLAAKPDYTIGSSLKWDPQELVVFYPQPIFEFYGVIEMGGLTAKIQEITPENLRFLADNFPGFIDLNDSVLEIDPGYVFEKTNDGKIFRRYQEKTISWYDKVDHERKFKLGVKWTRLEEEIKLGQKIEIVVCENGLGDNKFAYFWRLV